MKTKIAFGLVAAFVVAQLVPLDRSNPPVESEVPAPPEVRRILERSCYDCHSNETRWPWYAWVAPVSWLVVYDVHEAREHMNYSTWNAYEDWELEEFMEEGWELVEEGEMPLWFYLPLHPEAELSEADMQALRAWMLGAG